MLRTGRTKDKFDDKSRMKKDRKLDTDTMLRERYFDSGDREYAKERGGPCPSDMTGVMENEGFSPWNDSNSRPALSNEAEGRDDLGRYLLKLWLQCHMSEW